MMIAPETYYEMNLKGKTPKEIMSAIRGLKQEIGRLKNVAEHPEYQCMMHPSESTRIWCYRLYLERAKQALIDAGGTYTPSKAEIKAAQFDANVPHISKVEFEYGGFFSGYETRTYTIDGEDLHMNVEHSLILKPSNLNEVEYEELDKETLLDGLLDLHIGEWRRNYDPSRFGYAVLDGTQWHLHIYFNGAKPVKIEGSNDYPYNFDRLLSLFDIDPIDEDYEEESEE